MMLWDHHYTFVGPDGRHVEVAVLRDATLVRPRCQEEPADISVKTRLVVNEVDVDPVRYPDLVQFVEEYGARR